MYKLKLKIMGMACNACVQTIEEKLSTVAGIWSAKVNYESQKAVVIYDEEKIKAQEIKQIIKSAGSFETEQISDSAEAVLSEPQTPFVETVAPARDYAPGLNIKMGKSKESFIKGFITGIAIFLVLGAVYLLGARSSGNTSFFNSGSRSGGTLAAGGNPTPAPSAPRPTQPNQVGRVKAVAKDDHIRGANNPQVTLIEYSDFECPFCKRFHQTMQQVMITYQDQVAWAYRHFPLSFHANAQKEAEASECANELGGNDAFWKYTDAIFERTTSNGTGFALNQLVPLAKELGLPEAKFKECLDSGKYAAHVNQDLAEGQQSGVNGTPGTFVVSQDGKQQYIPGALPWEQVKSVIDSLL